MRIAVKVAMTFVLQYFYVTPAQTAKEVSRCSASAAELTKEATVKCHFPINIEESKTNFEIYYRSHSNVVSECMWTAGALSCWDEDGYQSDNSTTKPFTLRIPHFTQNHAGNYTCNLLAYKNKSCTLKIKTPSSQVLDTALTVVVPVSVVVVAVVLAVALWCCWRRKRLKNSRTPAPDEKDSANSDQRDNLVNQSKESEDPSTKSPMPSGTSTDWQTSEDQLTFLDEDRKQAPSTKVLSTPREKRDSQQTPERSLQSVIELFKNFPQSFSDGPVKSINKQSIMTKMSYRSGADGSVEIALESNLSCPETLPEQDAVSLGQQKMQQEPPSNVHKEQTSLTPSKISIVDYRETELKNSIDVQEEQMTSDVHRGFVEPDIQIMQHEDSINSKQSLELKKPATQEDKPSSPPELVSPASDSSANTENDYREKPEETSKLLDKWSIVDQESPSQTFETQVDPEISLSHLTTATKLSEDNMEQQEFSSQRVCFCNTTSQGSHSAVT